MMTRVYNKLTSALGLYFVALLTSVKTWLK